MAMNFFERQSRARAQSRRLVILFALAVIGIVAAIDVVVLLVLRGSAGQGAPLPAGAIVFWTSCAVLATIAVASLFRTASLSSGGGAVARALGATLVSPDTGNPQHRRLRNVVEEMAIASGVPVPQIYVLEQEAAINAFAAGYSPADAAVTVTRGALDTLTRDELQGVVAHEFSHVLNGDMRLNIRLMGLLFGILVIGIIGREVLTWAPRGRYNSRDSRNGSGLYLVALALMVLGYIGVFFGRLIKAGVSRQREYLADASAVQFTRQTAGLAGALKKAAGLDAGTRLVNTNAEEVAHMLFGDGVGYSALFATHPPLLSRIRRLDPAFSATQLGELSGRLNAPDYRPEDEDSLVKSDFAPQAAVALSPAAVLTRVAAPDDEDYDAARALHGSIPESWLAAAHDEGAAPDAVFALLVQADAEVRERQLARIAADWGVQHRSDVESLLAARGALQPVQRLPLLAVVLPTLRRRPRDQLLHFMETVDQLIRADGRIDVFEYCLGRLLHDQLEDVLAPSRVRVAGSRRLDSCRAQAVDLLAVLAQSGSSDRESARRAFLAGINELFPRDAIAYQPPEDWIAAVDAALDTLDELQPAGKLLLIEGLTQVLSADGRVTLTEAELLRVVCGALHCPLPPLLTDRL
jgi:Zn-dependent protease with chaperone function